MPERFLVVGLGSIGRRHVRLLREMLPNARIAVLRHQVGEDLTGIGVERCLTVLEEAIQFRPHVALVASPSSMHLDAALPLARAGVHLLIEKPISNSTDRVTELIDVCGTHRIVLMTGYNLRFLASLRRFRELITDGLAGRILSVRAEIGQFLPSWRPGLDYRESVSARRDLGGGVLLELSHEFDYLRWLFGEVEWVNAVHRKQSDLEVDVEDTAHIILGFNADAKGKQLVGTLNMDFIRHDATRTCTAIGEVGSLRWNALSGTVEHFEMGGDAWRVVFAQQDPKDESYREEWRHFLACVADGRTPSISGADGLAVLRIVEAVQQSSTTGSAVSVTQADEASGGPANA